MKIEDFTERHPLKQLCSVLFQKTSVSKMYVLQTTQGNLFFFHLKVIMDSHN